jgi:hypothetical protein
VGEGRGRVAEQSARPRPFSRLSLTAWLVSFAKFERYQRSPHLKAAASALQLARLKNGFVSAGMLGASSRSGLLCSPQKLPVDNGESSQAFARCYCANPLKKTKRSISEEQGPSGPF